SIAETPTHLFVGSERGFYNFDKKSGETAIFSKVNGFSDVDVAKIKYHENLNIVFIAYENTNIDLIRGNRIVNIPDLYRENIIGLKQINDITFNGNLAYLSCSFGVVIIDLATFQIKDSYLNVGRNGKSVPVNSLGFMNDSIYLATSEGIMSAPQSGKNLSDYNSWNLIRETIPLVSRTFELEVFHDKLYVDIDSVIEVYDGQNFTWSYYDVNERRNTRSIEVAHNQLIVGRAGEIEIIQPNGSKRIQNDNVFNFATIDVEGNIWNGGDFTGLQKITPQGSYSFVRPNGPSRSTSFAMKPVFDDLFVVGGGMSPSRSPIFSKAGYYVFDGTRWDGKDDDPRIEFAYDLVALEHDPGSNEVFIGCHGYGLIHLKNKELVELYTSSNSGLSDVSGFVLIDGVALDEQRNLWIANNGVEKSLVVRTVDGKWNSFELPTQDVAEIVVDRLGQKWVASPKSSSVGIVVFKEEDGVMGERFTSRSLVSAKNQGGLPTNIVLALAVDKDGRIWIGTDQGIAIYHNPGVVFTTDTDANRPIISDNEDVGYLLGNEVINDIQVDGANRKWVATNTGAWLISEDAGQVLKHFTTENSPLLSNTILTLGIMPESGEVFFGTDKGIISYRSDASEGSDKHGKVVLYPNPVRPDYKGPITITGLPENATVKITDNSGRVVYEMIANGGTAVWDGNNFNGVRAQTGIYLFFTANEDDEDAMVSKLLLVN
ncbi:MAG: hypothetical protein ACI9NN_001487, partial [Bacteroidia bacterium]